MRKGHTIDIVFVLLLFCIFAASVLLVLLTGAGTYQGIAESMENHYQERTCINYIATKIRHYDTEGSVELVDGTGDAAIKLKLSETIDGTAYNTFIYYYNGMVMELFTEEGLEIDAGGGFEIIEAEGITFEMASDNLLRIECTGAGGTSAELFVSLRSQGVA